MSDSGRVLSCDASFGELFSVPANLGVPGGALADLVAWLDQNAGDVGTRVAELLESGSERRGELTTTNGRVIVWHCTRLQGEEAGSVYCFHDVAEGRAALQALRDAESWLQMFAAQTGGAIVELDETGRILGTWSADGEILTHDERRVHGLKLTEILGGDYAAELERIIGDVIAGGDENSFEYVASEAAGGADDRRVFAMTVRLLSTDDEARRPTVSVLVRDITEQTRIQTKLVQAERLASVGLLAAGVAHEINNPLTYMVMNFNRVRRGIHALGDAELEQCVDMMVEGAQRVQEIVRDLQRFSRSDRGEVREPLDIRNVLNLTLGMVSFELERHARLVRELGEVPLVMATEGRLGQVFLNLILNAVQSFSPEEDKSEQNEIRLVTLTDANGDAVVEVRDTGVGIDAAAMRKIFDPFYTTKPSNRGTGLGLSICHGIVRSLGGDITAESTVGVGTTFRVVLPPAPAPAREASEDAP